jgi:hypothetical protein
MQYVHRMLITTHRHLYIFSMYPPLSLFLLATQWPAAAAYRTDFLIITGFTKYLSIHLRAVFSARQQAIDPLAVKFTPASGVICSKLLTYGNYIPTATRTDKDTSRKVRKSFKTFYMLLSQG